MRLWGVPAGPPETTAILKLSTMAGIWIPCNTSANKLKYGGKGFFPRIFLPGRGQSIKIKKILFA
ncbi:hypothetical protein K370107A2_05680 [Merdimmobilis hominis]